MTRRERAEFALIACFMLVCVVVGVFVVVTW